jgi:vacuolar-type H+-ATPase subunit H
MRPFSTLLHRLRRFGAPPGRPADTIAVPASPVEDAETELAVVFATLDDLEREASDRRTQATAQAATIITAAQREAAAVREQADRRAVELADQARDAARRAADEEAAAVLADADHEAARIAATAAQQTPRLVAELIAAVEGMAA